MNTKNHKGPRIDPFWDATLLSVFEIVSELLQQGTIDSSRFKFE